MVPTWTNPLVKIGAFLGIWLLAWGGIAFPLLRKFQWRPFCPLAPEKKLLLLLPLYGIAPFLIGGANILLEQSWRDLGWWLNWEAGRSLLAGLGIAIAGLGGLLALKIQSGLVTVTRSASLEAATRPGAVSGMILTLLAVGLGIGGVEELVFRGWMQTQLELTFAPWLAATLGSAVFAVSHLIWEGRSGLWQQPGLWLLGGVLVIARGVDGGSLALAWGLHAGWVWGLACIGELLTVQPQAQRPIWLGGRPDQPLTGLLDFALMVATGGLLLVWAQRFGA